MFLKINLKWALGDQIVKNRAFVNGQLISQKIFYLIVFHISFKYLGVQNSDLIFFLTRSSVNGGCFSDNASVSSAGLVAIFIYFNLSNVKCLYLWHIKMIVFALTDNDCEMTTLRRPKKGFWHSLVKAPFKAFSLSIITWLLFILGVFVFFIVL